MADKKPSTADILAMARKQAKATEGTPVPAPAIDSPPPPPVAEVIAASPAPAVEKPKPKSTAEILAAARSAKAVAPAAAPAAAPKSTADILAAARAGSGAPKSAVAAVVKTPSVSAAVVAPAGDKPSLQEMLKAAKAAKSSDTAVAAPAIAAKPKLPPKPAAKGKTTERRSFFVELLEYVASPFVIGWTVLGGISAVWGLATARFMMPNTVLELPSRFKIGPASDFPFGTVNEKFKASRGVWIVHTDSYDGKNIIYALQSICTHLGCTPNWLDAEQKFKCPCHGSGFYINGVNFEGPAPRPLERMGLRLSEDGSLEVDKSVKFQEELGQWADPKSFVSIT